MSTRTRTPFKPAGLGKFIDDDSRKDIRKKLSKYDRDIRAVRKRFGFKSVEDLPRSIYKPVLFKIINRIRNAQTQIMGGPIPIVGGIAEGLQIEPSVSADQDPLAGTPRAEAQGSDAILEDVLPIVDGVLANPTLEVSQSDLQPIIRDVEEEKDEQEREQKGEQPGMTDAQVNDLISGSVNIIAWLKDGGYLSSPSSELQAALRTWIRANGPYDSARDLKDKAVARAKLAKDKITPFPKPTGVGSTQLDLANVFNNLRPGFQLTLEETGASDEAIRLDLAKFLDEITSSDVKGRRIDLEKVKNPEFLKKVIMKKWGMFTGRLKTREVFTMTQAELGTTVNVLAPQFKADLANTGLNITVQEQLLQVFKDFIEREYDRAKVKALKSAEAVMRDILEEWNAFLALEVAHRAEARETKEEESRGDKGASREFKEADPEPSGKEPKIKSDTSFQIIGAVLQIVLDADRFVLMNDGSMQKWLDTSPTDRDAFNLELGKDNPGVNDKFWGRVQHRQAQKRARDGGAQEEESEEEKGKKKDPRVPEKPPKVKPFPPPQDAPPPPPDVPEGAPKKKPPPDTTARPENAHKNRTLGVAELRPFFSKYHGLDILQQTGRQALEDIREYDLFDLPIDANTELNNPLYVHNLKKQQQQYSGAGAPDNVGQPTASQLDGQITNFFATTGFRKGSIIYERATTWTSRADPTDNTLQNANSHLRPQSQGGDENGIPWYDPDVNNYNRGFGNATRENASEVAADFKSLYDKPDLMHFVVSDKSAPSSYMSGSSAGIINELKPAFSKISSTCF